MVRNTSILEGTKYALDEVCTQRWIENPLHNRVDNVLERQEIRQKWQLSVIIKIIGHTVRDCDCDTLLTSSLSFNCKTDPARSTS